MANKNNYRYEGGEFWLITRCKQTRTGTGNGKEAILDLFLEWARNIINTETAIWGPELYKPQNLENTLLKSKPQNYSY